MPPKTMPPPTTNYLVEENWPIFHGNTNKETLKLYEWLKQVTRLVIVLENTVKDQKVLIETQGKTIEELKAQPPAQSTVSSAATNLASSWVTVVKNNKKMPEDQVTVAKAMTIEWNEKRRRGTNVVINGLAMSTKATAQERLEDDKLKAEEVVREIFPASTDGIKYVRRANQKAIDNQGNAISVANRKPSPVIVEFADTDHVWSVLNYAKKLRTSTKFKDVYVNKDFTPAESSLNYELRKERNRLNGLLENSSTKVWAIVGSKLVKVNRRS
jgi:hypothetical protein